MRIKKDSKGRNLYKNEYQMKDGRYRFRYINEIGKTVAVYSWRLVPTDKAPNNKKFDQSLREKESKILQDIEDNISAPDMTVYELIKKYLSIKPKLANATKINYEHMLEKNIKTNKLGYMKVASVKKSDIRLYYAYLYSERKFGEKSIKLYQNLIYPAFQMAVDDCMIRLNPCKGCMKDYSVNSMNQIRIH